MDQKMVSNDPPQELAAIDDLPEELAIEILSRQPVKSLMRFTCVCKSWHALVETPSFISKHLNHHKNNNTTSTSTSYSKIIVKQRRRDNKDYFSLLSYETLDVISTDLGFQSFRDDHPGITHEFLGCCNGVICVYDGWYRDFILWNPATRQMKLVPESTIPHPKDSVLSGLDVGFGYDVKTNDYKVIRLVIFLYPPLYDRQGIERTEVYSLSTDSWTLIDAVVPASARGTSHHRTCVNGIYSICGSVSDDKEWKEVLISFDMSKDVFLLTPFPEEFMEDADGNICHKAFTVLNEESFGIIQDISGGIMNHFDVWVLNEYGPDGSFTKVFTVGPFSDFHDLYPLGVWKNNELFFEGSDDGELVLGDPNTPRHLKSLFQVDNGAYRYTEILPYKESLVSIKPTHHINKNNNIMNE